MCCMTNHDKNWHYYKELYKVAKERLTYVLKRNRPDLEGAEQKIEEARLVYEARLNDFMRLCKEIEFCPLENGASLDDVRNWMEEHCSDKDDCITLRERAETLESKTSTYPGDPTYFRKTLEKIMPKKKAPESEEAVVEIAVEVEMAGAMPAPAPAFSS